MPRLAIVRLRHAAVQENGAGEAVVGIRKSHGGAGAAVAKGTISSLRAKPVRDGARTVPVAVQDDA